MISLQKASVIVLFSLTSFSAFSQLSNVSFKLGANVSTVHNDNLIDNRLLLGTEGGVGVGFVVNRHNGNNLFINLEMLSSKRGYKQVYDQEEFKVHFYYISFPLTLGYSPVAFLSLDAGLEYNALIEAKWSNGNERIKVLENYRSNDWGLVGGMTCFKDKRINAFFRYTFGLKDILVYSSVDNFGNLEKGKKDFNNRSIKLGISFNIYVD